jgi:hypothetical protein
MFVRFLFYNGRTMLRCLGDSCQGVNTTSALVQICQNDQFRFSFLETTYLNFLQLGAATISVVMYWYMQRYWKIDSKKVVRLLGIVLPLYGQLIW